MEIANEYNKPVVFSAIGVESYDEKNEKCQRLKAVLNYDCVRSVTTRDKAFEMRIYTNLYINFI